jgi:complement component 1 Q subcomponent-binding protein, mitochondrial
MKLLSRIARQKVGLFNLPIKSFSAKDNLVNIFTQEIEHEEKEYKPISPNEKQTFFDNSGFKFIDSQNSSRMQLQKTVNDFQVNISYFPKPPPEEEEENNTEQQQSNFTEFQVLINKVGKSAGFLIDAISTDSQININHIHCSDNIQEFYNKYISGTSDADSYQGPDFNTLDNSLQQAFYDLLEEFGLNEECANFIEVSALDKDQALYMKWLKNAKNCLV